MSSKAKAVTSRTGEARVGHADENKGAVGPTKDNGQHEDYWVLSEEERAKGFIRPVRHNYVHRGIRPKNPTRELTAEEQVRHDGHGYVAFEKYPSDGTINGRFWTQEQLDSGCGSVTTMNNSIAETYARDPGFYGSTFCVNCQVHLSVSEFVWDGTDEKVGS